MSGIVGLRVACNTRTLGSDRHLRPRDDGSGLVRNGPRQAPARLTVEEWANRKYEGTENCEQRAFGQHQHPPWRAVMMRLVMS